MAVDLDFHRASGKIVAILGARRSGKSTCLLQLHEQPGLVPAQGIWVDSTEYLWQGFQADDWKLLWDCALRVYQGREPVFFPDEIQQMRDFAPGLRFLQN